MTNWMKVEKILHEIRETMGEKMLVEDPALDAIGLLYFSFGGRIGADITFSGRQMGNNGVRAVDLKCQDELLAHIRAYNDFEIAPDTSVLVASSGWMSKDAEKKTYQERAKDQGFSILYNAAKETPAAVIDNIYNAIVNSKQKAADVTKLSQLNLPPLKVRDAVDQIIDLFNGMKIPTQSTDAGREM